MLATSLTLPASLNRKKFKPHEETQSSLIVPLLLLSAAFTLGTRLASKSYESGRFFSSLGPSHLFVGKSHREGEGEEKSLNPLTAQQISLPTDSVYPIGDIDHDQKNSASPFAN